MMDRTDFNMHVSSNLAAIEELLLKKGKVYDGDDLDIFYNAWKIADLQGVSLVRAYANLVSKHINTFYSRESLLNEESFMDLTGDILAYFILIRIAYYEQEREKNSAKVCPT